MLSWLGLILFAAFFLCSGVYFFIQAERIRYRDARPFGPKWIPLMPRLRSATPGNPVNVWILRFLGGLLTIIGILFLQLIIRSLS
jgi:hypothetical protein